MRRRKRRSTREIDPRPLDPPLMLSFSCDQLLQHAKGRHHLLSLSPERATQSLGTAWRRREVSYRPVLEDKAMQQVWTALASCISAAPWQGDSRFQSSAGPRLSVWTNLGSSLVLCDEDMPDILRTSLRPHSLRKPHPSAEGWWLHDSYPISTPGSSAYTTCLSSLGAGLGGWI